MKELINLIDNKNYNEVDSFAGQLSENFKRFTASNSDALNVHELVNALGGKVVTAPDSLVEESMVINNDADFTIYIPPFTSLKRDRFTIAHELGHYFLHYLIAEPGEKRKVFNRGIAKDGPDEGLANRFAGALLMPSNLYEKIYLECSGDFEIISDYFNVSIPAARVRQEILNIK